MIKLIVFFCAVLFSSVSLSDLSPIDLDGELEGVSAQAGITVEVYANVGVDLYYLQEGDGGGAIKIEGARAVKADPVTGVLSSEAAPLKASIDVAGGGEGGIMISSTYAPEDNAVFKIDAIRLGSVGNAEGNDAFRNAYQDINAIPSPSLSLGKFNISGLDGTAKMTVRAQ